MDTLGNELALPDVAHMARITSRLVVAMLLGAWLGAEREATGKAAGLRTHMLVVVGAALYVLAAAEVGLKDGDMGRIVQGIAAGVGFLGAGTILKRSSENEITGLTTAASIWLTAAVGMAAGIGRLWLAVTATACAWLILFAVGVVERRLTPPRQQQ